MGVRKQPTDFSDLVDCWYCGAMIPLSFKVTGGVNLGQLVKHLDTACELIPRLP